MTGRLTRTARLTAFAACGLLLFAVTASAAGAAKLGGTATLTKPDGSHFSTGGSTKAFTLALPRHAACAGSSRAGYRIYSYVVQHGTDVAGLTFSTVPSVGYGLVDAKTGAYYGAHKTADAAGHLPALPDFAWAPLLGGGITKTDLLSNGSTGQWDAGIACVNSTGHVTSSWSSGVLFTATHRDPNGFSYCGVPTVPAELPEVPYAAALPIVGLAVIGGYVSFRRRRARTRAESAA